MINGEISWIRSDMRGAMWRGRNWKEKRENSRMVRDETEADKYVIYRDLIRVRRLMGRGD